MIKYDIADYFVIKFSGGYFVPRNYFPIRGEVEYAMRFPSKESALEFIIKMRSFVPYLSAWNNAFEEDKKEQLRNVLEKEPFIIKHIKIKAYDMGEEPYDIVDCIFNEEKGVWEIKAFINGTTCAFVVATINTKGEVSWHYEVAKESKSVQTIVNDKVAEIIEHIAIG